MGMKVFGLSSGTFVGKESNQGQLQGVFSKENIVDRATFIAYVTRKLRGELDLLRIGKNDSYTCRDLTRDENIVFKSVCLAMEEANETKDTWLTEKVFKEVLGKF